MLLRHHSDPPKETKSFQKGSIPNHGTPLIIFDGEYIVSFMSGKLSMQRRSRPSSTFVEAAGEVICSTPLTNGYKYKDTTWLPFPLFCDVVGSFDPKSVKQTLI